MGAPKSAIDVQGFEYDWLGVDEDGRVALFSTAGGGYAPPSFLRDTDVGARGLYAFDSDPHGDPVAAPAVFVRFDALPATVANVAVRCAFRFDR